MEKEITKEDIRKCIEDIYNTLPKKERTFKLYCYSEKCVEEFNRLFKEEVERKYEKEKTTDQPN